MFQFWQFCDLFACEVVNLYCLILQQEIFTSDLNISDVEFCMIFYFTKVKGDHKVLKFRSYSSELGTCGEYSINKKIKAIVIIQICDQFDIFFWWF